MNDEEPPEQAPAQQQPPEYEPPDPAPDATPDEVGPPSRVGFDGRPLKQSGMGFSGGAYPSAG